MKIKARKVENFLKIIKTTKFIKISIFYKLKINCNYNKIVIHGITIAKNTYLMDIKIILETIKTLFPKRSSGIRRSLRTAP